MPIGVNPYRFPTGDDAFFIAAIEIAELFRRTLWSVFRGYSFVFFCFQNLCFLFFLFFFWVCGCVSMGIFTIFLTCFYLRCVLGFGYAFVKMTQKKSFKNETKRI